MSAASGEEPRVSSSSAARTVSATPLATSSASDSCYFPGCRKDANCKCEICLASIQATQDLFPRPRRTARGPARKPVFEPITPPQSPPVTTVSTVTLSATPPPLKSTARSRPSLTVTARSKKNSNRWLKILGFVTVGIVSVWILTPMLAVMMHEFMPRLTADAVRRIGEEAASVGSDWNSIMRIVEQRISAAAGQKAGSCSTEKGAWKLRQESRHNLLRWHCMVYKSVVEEVVVWGTPIRTSGILPASLSSRSLIILSGKITELSGDGRRVIVTAGSGNMSNCWSSQGTTMPLQLEPGTYVLQYAPALAPATIMSMARTKMQQAVAAMRPRFRNAAGVQIRPT